MLSKVRTLYFLLLKSQYFSNHHHRLKKYFYLTVGAVIAAEVMMVVQYIPIKGITDLIVLSVSNGEGPNPSELSWFTFLFIGSFLFGVVLHVVMDNWRNHFLQGVFAVLHSSAMEKMLSLPTSWHVQHATGEKDSKVKENVDRLDYIVAQLAYGAVPVLIRILVTAIFLWWVGFWLLVFGFGATIGYFVILRINLATMKRLSKEWHDQREEVSSYSKSLMANWYAIKSFGSESRYSSRHSSHYQQYWDDDVNRHWTWRGRLSVHEVYIALATVSFYWAIAKYGYIQSDITVGTIVMAMFWMTRMLNNLYQLNDFLRYFYRAIESAEELIQFFSAKSDMPQPEKPIWPKDLEGEITLRNVTFRYPETEINVLSDINLDIKPGEVVALVGESGGGKSTLASLIAGERPVTTGQLLIDGVDIKQLDLNRFKQEAVVIVPQRPSLLPETIFENVRLGKIGASNNEVDAALRKSYSDVFVSNLKDGVSSEVGEQGVFLSGGQQQRIAIARAFIRDQSRILILDEATSSLDAQSQKEVQSSLERLIAERDNKTVIVIAHRLSTVKIAQRIIVLKDGHIIGQGSHEELLKSCQYYYDLCNLELKDHAAFV